MIPNKTVDKPKVSPKEPVIEQTSSYRAAGDPLHMEFNYPGLSFRWVNVNRREQSGWGIWQPVWRDSEIGNVIKSQLGATFDKFAGLATSTNMFHVGNDLVLAYTSIEQLESLLAASAKAADDQLATVEQQGGQMRHTYISTNR